MKKLFKKNQIFGQWKLVSYLGGGGNGEVWKCVNESKEVKAIKILKKIKPKAYERFIDETKVIEENSDITGIIPIIDKNLPSDFNESHPFYVMPIAESLELKLANASFESKLKAIQKIAKTLDILHNRGISHRDIKPPNLLFYNGKPVIADFGLVRFPNKRDNSHRNEEIGPKWTMAPEMRREAKKSDGVKADIYSLAKTLWILLTGRYKGFDGQYSTDSIIELKSFYADSYTSPIDKLLIASTDHNPNNRPSAKEFEIQIENWVNLNKSFREKNLHHWFSIQSKLFPASIPKKVEWSNIEDIVNVLNLISNFDNLNHAFFPNGGGLDLKKVTLSFEKNCIEMDFGLSEIVKPKRLLFESFIDNPEWNYFRLELHELKHTNLKIFGIKGNNHDEYHEIVTEVSPANYFPIETLHNPESYLDEESISDFLRHVTRWFKGNFVFFSKSSPYNLVSSTYDGRHDKMDSDKFRNYIQKCVNGFLNKKLSTGRIQDRIKEREKSEYLDKLIPKEDVYRCGFCGGLIDGNGEELSYEDSSKSWEIIQKYGESVIKRAYGKCCENEY